MNYQTVRSWKMRNFKLRLLTTRKVEEKEVSRFGPGEIPTFEKAFVVHTSHWCWYR